MDVSDAVSAQVLAGEPYRGAGEARPEADEPGKSIPGALLSDLLRGRLGAPVENVDLCGLTIEGDVDLSFLRWNGRLSLLNCRITGVVNLDRVVVQGRISLDGSFAQAVRAIDARIDGTLHLRDGFEAERGVDGLGLSVTGSLSVREATLGADPAAPARAALDIYRASLGDLFVVGATLNGGLYANGSVVGRNVRLQGARITSRRELGLAQSEDAGNGVSLANARVGGAIFFATDAEGPMELRGSVMLNGATCEVWVVRAEQLATLRMAVESFVFSRIRPATGDDVLGLLQRSKLAPRAYGLLASLFESNGMPAQSRTVRMRLQHRLAREYPFWSREGFTRRLLGLVVGYGYRPSSALWWLVGCLAAATLLIRSQPSMFRAGEKNLAAEPSWIQTFGLAVDNVVPLVSTGPKDQWILDTAATGHWPWLAALFVLKIAGWALALLAAASVTGLIRNK